MRTPGREAANAETADLPEGEQALGAAKVGLGDFWIPQRGVFAIGRAFFEPAGA